MSTTLSVQKREVSSKGHLRQIRTEGKVPGVIYGKGLEAPAAISIDSKDLMALLKSNPHNVVEVEVPGSGKHPVMMADLQRDSITQKVMHIDFQRINMNEKITTFARLEVSGTSAGEKEGGMLQTIMFEVEIKCYPKDIPESIEIDVTPLAVGENLTISDLKLPKGVEATQDPAAVIVAVLAPQKAVEEETGEAAPAVAETEANSSGDGQAE